MHVEIVKGTGRQPWRVKLYAANGEQLVISEGYVTLWNARRAAVRMFPTLPAKIVRP